MSIFAKRFRMTKVIEKKEESKKMALPKATKEVGSIDESKKDWRKPQSRARNIRTHC